MAQSDMLKRYLDAGMAFTQMTRERAEAIVKELVKAGEVQREKTEERVNDLVERSRKNTEELVAMIRREVAEQLRAMGLDDLAKRAGAPAPTKKAATTKKAPAATKAGVAKKAGAAKKVGAAKKAGAAKKTPAKKATAAKKAAKTPTTE